MIPYRRIMGLCDRFQDRYGWQDGDTSGRPISEATLEKLVQHAPSICFGMRGPCYDWKINHVYMPMPRREVRIRDLYALAHEIGHSRQESLPNYSTAWLSYPSPEVLWIEWDATRRGWALLLKEGLLRPCHLKDGFLYWATYLSGYVSGMARRRAYSKPDTMAVS